MQIFSKLQRNGTDKIFIKLLIIYFVNFFSSFSPFFPIMIGFFLLCESYFYSLLFIMLFCLFHNFNSLFFVLIFLLSKLILIRKIKTIINKNYQNIICLFLIYFLIGIYLITYINSDTFLLLSYLLYNYAFDLIILRLLKCKSESF